MTTVEVNGVAKTFGITPVLSDMSARFAPGSFTSLLGPSGSGKTTLLRVIAGFAAPDRGHVTIGDRDVTRVPVWARNIGMVFQSYALFPHMTIADNIGFGLARRGIRGAEARRRVDEALDLVRLPGFGQRRPKQLSGGQQQRVALARAIVTRPDVLLLDEPLSALDRRLRQNMQVELLRIQRESGLTTIFVTHDQEEALTLSDQVAILDKGRILQVGTPAEVYEQPRSRFAAEFLGDVNLLRGHAEGDRVMLSAGPVIRMASPSSGDVLVAVRPEKIAMTPAVPGGGEELQGLNQLEARVTSVIYAGASVSYRAEAAGITFKIFAQNREARLHGVGEIVTLAWPAAHTIRIDN